MREIGDEPSSWRVECTLIEKILEAGIIAFSAVSPESLKSSLGSDGYCRSWIQAAKIPSVLIASPTHLPARGCLKRIKTALR